MRAKGSVQYVAVLVTVALVAQVSRVCAQNATTPPAGTAATADTAPAATITPPTATPPTPSAATLAAPPAVGTGALSDDSVTRRTTWIQAQLDREQPASQRWFWIWTGATITMILGQGGLAVGLSLPGVFTNDTVSPHPGDPNPMLAAERFTRTAQDQWRQWVPAFVVGTISTVLSVVPFLIFPFSPAWSAGRLRAAAGETPAQRVARLQLGERLLREGAETEEFGRSWIMHVINCAVAAAGSAVIWFAWPNDYAIANGLINFGFTLGFAEMQMATQPSDLIALHRAYRSGDIDFDHLPPANPRPRVSMMPYLSPVGAGIGLRF